MNLKCDKTILSKIKSCQGLLNNFNSEGILLRGDGTLSIFANNLDMELEFKTDIEAEGQAIVDGKKLYQIIAQAKAQDEIGLKTTEKQMQINYGKAIFRLNLMEDEYLTFPVLETLNSTKYNLNNIDRVLVAVAKDYNKPTLRGVYFDFKRGNLVATDGYRLAIQKGMPALDGENIIVPGEAIKLLRTIMSEVVEIRWDNSMVEFAGEDFILRTKLIEGKYPDYINLIPENPYAMQVNAKDFLAVVNRVSLVHEQVNFKISQKEILVFAKSDVSMAEESCDIDYNGDDLEIAFNGVFLKEILSVLDGDIVFRLRDDKSAGVLRQGDDFLCALMPMRLK